MPTPSIAVMAELAQGVTDLLNAQTFSMEFEAVRGWAPVIPTERLTRPTVSVVPNLKRSRRLSRSGKSRLLNCTIDVTIARQHGDSAPGEVAPVLRCDEIAALAQEIEDFLADAENRIVTDNLNTAPDEVDFENDDEALISDGIFRLTVSVTYQLTTSSA